MKESNLRNCTWSYAREVMASLPCPFCGREVRSDARTYWTHAPDVTGAGCHQTDQRAGCHSCDIWTGWFADYAGYAPPLEAWNKLVARLQSIQPCIFCMPASQHKNYLKELCQYCSMRKEFVKNVDHAKLKD